ncbi:hypothetical protein CYFUS_003024 [Cystobacter fuscus]|uniref:Uncharacterized protein n=1 Tax=Cystobacter fuscus TaxID=43 RepID=A0A250J0U4_9BACT|nr:hypothetical protein [Cystobacter fuscus]ATB37599.1 hypothetical protein CYFUS_003024 [Cystobacter fuscus]
MTRSSAFRVLLATAVLLCVPASATTLLKMDLPELSHSADVIVHGTVRRMESRWSGDHRLIVTDVEIQVTESLKGQASGTVLVTQRGGEVGDIGQKVSGLASFAPNEEVVVFLERRGPAFHVSGMAQGKYKVLRTEGETRAMAVPESTGEALLLDARTHQTVTSSRPSLPLSDLKAAIRAALQQPAPMRSQEKRP